MFVGCLSSAGPANALPPSSASFAELFAVFDFDAEAPFPGEADFVFFVRALCASRFEIMRVL